MASIRGILNIQSLNELTSENRSASGVFCGRFRIRSERPDSRHDTRAARRR